VAEAAGFKVGDLIVSLDGSPVRDKETSNLLMSQKRWGDAAEYVVKRGEQTLTLVAKFRRPERAAAPASRQ
jgi:S1-C subfamily serine protease